LPDHVTLNTSTDSFQPLDPILDISWETISLLFQYNIGINLLTKGVIPAEFISLFQRYPELVTITVGLVTLDDHFQAIYEPGAASIQERLDNISRLKKAGIRVRVRIDPLIPGVNDQPSQLAALLQLLAHQGINAASVSYLMLRPGIWSHLRQELPVQHYKLIESHYKLRPLTHIAASPNTQLLSPQLRKRKYQLMRELAAREGLTLSICACKNPELSSDLCHQPGEGSSFLKGDRPGGRQLSLF